MKLHPIPLAGFLLLLHFASQCQVSSRYDLLLKSGSYLPAENINVDRVSTFNLTASRSFGKTFAIIQFQELPTLSQRQALQTAGIELLEYLPNYAYTASISRSLDANTLKQFNARALIEPSAVQKMHPKLFTGELPGWALKSGGSVNVWISIARSFDLQLVKMY